MNVAERIRELRIEKGLTVNRLANLAGVSQSHLREIELGNKQPTVEYLSYICAGLGIDLEYFFSTGKNDPLYEAIGNLNEEQKEALLQFLKTIQ